VGKDLATEGFAMSVDQQIMVKGHIDRQVLRDFAERPSIFDDDTVEQLWRHLDSCEDCIEEYDAFREDRLADRGEPDTSAETPPPAENVLDAHAIDPNDLESADVEAPEQDPSHVNGLVPVGDDPDRNGRAYKSKDGETQEATTEAPPETAPADTTTEAEAPSTAGEQPLEQKTGHEQDATEAESGESDEPAAIEGLIRGDVTATKDSPERLEMESAVEAGDRLARESAVSAVETRGAAGQGKTAEARKFDESDHDPFIDPTASRSSGGRRPRPASTSRVPTKKASPSRKPAAAPTRARPANAEPLEDMLRKLWALLAVPRNAVIGGAAVLLIAAGITFAILRTGGQKPSPVAGWAPLDVIETRVPLQEVLVRRIRNGRIPKARRPDVTLDFQGVDELVIAVDLDFIDRRASSYEVILWDPQGDSVFREEIPQVYLDDGRFFLKLVPKLFQPDLMYTLELVAIRHNGAQHVVAESLFDVRQ
jgi:hypothetical protein